MAFLLVTSDGHRGDVIRNVTVEQWQNAKFETLQDGTKCCTVSVWEHKTSTKMGAAVMVISNPRARRCILAFHDYVRPIFFANAPNKLVSKDNPTLPLFADREVKRLKCSDSMVAAFKRCLVEEGLATMAEIGGINAKDFW
jgi:hypothetical protein